MNRSVLCLFVSLLLLFSAPSAEAASVSPVPFALASCADPAEPAPASDPANAVLLFERNGLRIELLSGYTLSRYPGFSYVIKFTDLTGNTPYASLNDILLNGRISVDDVSCFWWNSNNEVPPEEDGQSVRVEYEFADDWPKQLRLAGESQLRSLSAVVSIGYSGSNIPIEVTLPDGMNAGLLTEPYRQARAEEQLLHDDENVRVRLLAMGDMYLSFGGELGIVLEITNNASRPVSYELLGAEVNGMYIECLDRAPKLDPGGVRLFYSSISRSDLDEQQVFAVNSFSVLLSETEKTGIRVPADRLVWYPVELSLAAPQEPEPSLGTVLYSRDGLSIGQRGVHESEPWFSGDNILYYWDMAIRNDTDEDISVDFVNVQIDGVPEPEDPFSDEPHLAGDTLIDVGAHCTRYVSCFISLPSDSERPRISFCFSVFTIDRSELLYSVSQRLTPS